MIHPTKEKIAMSTKFEQLLDYLVNEEMDKANELFHNIVVEKSREIYENLISEEEDEEMDEASEDEEMDESTEDDGRYDQDGDPRPGTGRYDAQGNQHPDWDPQDDREQHVRFVKKNRDSDMREQEDSYSMEADDESEIGGDATDDFIGDVETDDDMGDEEGEKGEDSAIFDIKNAIAELEAAFAELEAAQGSEEEHDEFSDDGEEGEEDFGDDDMQMGGDDMQMGKPAFEGRRVTREYVEKVGNDWDKNSQKTQGQYAGAGTGERQSAPKEGSSPVSSGKGKPTSGANASNLNRGGVEGQSNTGTSPGKVNRGITPEKGEQFTGKDWETNSSPTGKAGVKNLTKVAATGKNPGPVGSGTGDKAGQTSQSHDKPFLKKL